MHPRTLKVTINGTGFAGDYTARVYGMIPHKNGVAIELAGVTSGLRDNATTHTAIVLATMLLTLLAALHGADVRTPSSKPNIVVIYADDLGYGDVQCYNPERGKIPTPQID